MKTHNILIFHQEEAVRDSLHFVLSEEGYQCFSASRKSEVMEMLDSEKISILILESEMPGLLSMLQIFKEEVPYLKIILISSYAEAEMTQKALLHGAEDFVFKPLDFDELLSVIQKISVPKAVKN